jgi:hypothetical protein
MSLGFQDNAATSARTIANAKNDQLLIDGIFDERVQSKTPSDKRDEVFEFFAMEQLLKFADLSSRS